MEEIVTWCTPPAMPLLPKSGELHLWLIDLDIPPVDFARNLSTEEANRADRLLDTVGSRRFVAARGCMKKILADYLKTDAGGISFRYGGKGKPQIAGPGTRLRFNLSHSGHLALLALTCQYEIGVDIEPLKPRPILLAIARKMFGTKVHEMLASLDEPRRTEQFFQLWTALEARAKCQGSSVFGQPDTDIPVRNFAPEAGWIAAVAVSQGVPEISKWCTYRLTSTDF